MYLIKEIDFDVISDLWFSNLWVNSDNSKRKFSSIKFSEDKIKYCDYKPSYIHYIGLYYNDELIGCNSGYDTELGFRIRGLYVKELYRNRGFSKFLIKHFIHIAMRNHKFIWSIPRKNAFYSYEKCGFIRITDWFNEGMEFGPNCYAKLELYKE